MLSRLPKSDATFLLKQLQMMTCHFALIPLFPSYSYFRMVQREMVWETDLLSIQQLKIAGDSQGVSTAATSLCKWNGFQHYFSWLKQKDPLIIGHFWGSKLDQFFTLQKNTCNCGEMLPKYTIRLIRLVGWSPKNIAQKDSDIIWTSLQDWLLIWRVLGSGYSSKTKPVHGRACVDRSSGFSWSVSGGLVKRRNHLKSRRLAKMTTWWDGRVKPDPMGFPTTERKSGRTNWTIIELRKAVFG